MQVLKAQNVGAIETNILRPCPVRPSKRCKTSIISINIPIFIIFVCEKCAVMQLSGLIPDKCLFIHK